MPSKPPSNPTAQPSFTEADLALLQEYLERYKNAASLHGLEKKDARKRVLMAAQEALKASHSKLKQPEWDILKMKTKAWFNLHGRIRQPRTPYVKKTTWNVSRVVAHIKKHEVVEAVAESSGAKPGDRHNFLAKYQPGLSKIVKELPDDEKASYQIIADQWNKEGLPAEMRQKQADRNSRGWILEVAKQAWKTFGMRMVIFEGHTNGKQEHVYSTYDFNAQIGNPPPGVFIDDHLDVELQQRFEAEWAHYAHTALCADSGRDPEAGAAATGTRASPALIELDRDEYDLPILPPLNPSIKTNEINTLIRSFLGIHYAKLTQNPKASVHVPWMRLSENQEEFIDAEYLPELYTLMEPTRKRLADKRALIEFWLSRQEDPTIRHAFLFKAYPSGDDWIAYGYVPKLNTQAEHHSKKKAKGKKERKAKYKGKAAEGPEHQGTEPAKEVAVVHPDSRPHEPRKANEVGQPGRATGDERGKMARDSHSVGEDILPRVQAKVKAKSTPTNTAQPTKSAAIKRARSPDAAELASDGDEVVPTGRSNRARVWDDNTNQASRRERDDSDDSSSDSDSSEGNIVVPRNKRGKGRAVSEGFPGLYKLEATPHSPSLVANDDSDSATNSDAVSDTATTSLDDIAAGPSTPQRSTASDPGRQVSRSKVKRPSTWDLPAVPDLTGVTRSRTPTAKRREMEDRDARATESVAGSRPHPRPQKKADAGDVGNLVRSSRTMEGRLADAKKGKAKEQKRSR